MTTEHEQTPAAIWAGLTAEEREALQAVAKGHGNPGAKSLYERLHTLGLITLRHSDNYCKMLSLGWQALASTTPPAQPTTITAAQFFNEGYAAKIAAGECEVTFLGQLIRALSVHDDQYMIWPIDDNQVAGFLDFSDTLTVTWQPPAQPTGEADKYPEATKFGQELAAKSGGR